MFTKGLEQCLAGRRPALVSLRDSEVSVDWDRPTDIEFLSESGLVS